MRLAPSRRNRGLRAPHPPKPAPDPASLAAQVGRHLGWLEARGLAATTVATRGVDIERFVAWCEARGITRPGDLTRLVLDLFQRAVAHLEKPDGTTITVRTQRLKLEAVAGFCKWLARERLVLYNPAAELELPKIGRSLPRTVLTVTEVERVLAVPNTATPLGLRDRAILEVFYSTGIRRSELMRLTLRDVDFGRGILGVRQGKGGKDRFVPIGERALAWLAKYLDEVRPQLLFGHDDGTLFLTADGTPFGRNYLGQMVRRAIDASGIGKQGSCHLFRHTMATLMLEGGADIRYIQQMLGHAKLDTTQIYTQVSAQALKAIHDATHPGARLRRRQATRPGADDARDADAGELAEDEPDPAA
jgi:integrase/recombinase XerD